MLDVSKDENGGDVITDESGDGSFFNIDLSVEGRIRAVGSGWKA